MADIGRTGWRKPGSLLPCPGSLAATPRRHMAASWSSSAPARSGVRRSLSSLANRQLRIWASAVSRTRSHAPQNGRVTEPITPTRSGPPSIRKVSAGADRPGLPGRRPLPAPVGHPERRLRAPRQPPGPQPRRRLATAPPGHHTSARCPSRRQPHRADRADPPHPAARPHHFGLRPAHHSAVHGQPGSPFQVADQRRAATSSVSSCRTRRSISSRIGRTAARSRPAGSGRSQSR
jgi:hypothetical protein